MTGVPVMSGSVGGPLEMLAPIGHVLLVMLVVIHRSLAIR